MKTLLALVLCAGVAAAEPLPLPKYLPLPAGATTKTETFENYHFVEIGYPKKGKGEGWAHLKPGGRHWWVLLTTKPEYSAWDAALEKAGWEILLSQGARVAHLPAGAGHGEAWFISTFADRFELLEVVDLPKLTLPAPAATPEELKPGQDVPFLLPLPNMKQIELRLDADRRSEMTGPLTGGPFFVGPPVYELIYKGPREISSAQIQVTYKAALEAAGWTINYSNQGGMTTAHYAKNGRDLWVKVNGGDGSLYLEVGDQGAAEAAAKLKAALDKDGHVAVYGIYFDLDKDVLRPDSEATLQQILKLLQSFPKLRLEIQGHTDDTGKRPHNQTLSEARAASVKKWLVEHKVEDGRLTTKGYADTKPVADNKSASGRAKNRRVELLKL